MKIKECRFAESKKNKNIVYHVGDFSKKAEDLYQLNNGRSTGFFGTGHYFCTEWEYCVRQGGGHRPLYSIDISRYNLLKGSFSLHDTLKKANRYISSYGLFDKYKDYDENELSYIQIYYNDITFEGKEKLGYVLKEEYKYELEEKPNITFREFIDDWYERYNYNALIELLSKHKEFDSLVKELTSENPNFDKIDKLTENDIFHEDIHSRLHSLQFDKKMFLIELGMSESKFDKLCEEIYYDLKKYYEDGYLRTMQTSQKGEDSIPTRIIKAMGYDGIMPNYETDNISYGGIIYDIDMRDVTLLCDDVSKFKGDVINEKLSFKQLKDEIVPQGKGNEHLNYFYKQRNKLNGQGNRNIKFLSSAFDDTDGSMLFAFRTDSTFIDEPKKSLKNDNVDDGTLISNNSKEYLLQLKICDFYDVFEQLILPTDTNFTKEDMKAVLELSEEVRISCDCPSQYWMAGDYYLTKIDAELKQCTIAPRFWNLKRDNVKTCKHLLSLLNHISFFLPQMAMSVKKELKEYGLL